MAGPVFENLTEASKIFQKIRKMCRRPPFLLAKATYWGQNKQLNNLSGGRIVKNSIRRIALVAFGAVLAIGLSAGLGNTAKAGGYYGGHHGYYGHSHYSGYGYGSYGYSPSYSYSYPSYSYNYSPSYYGGYGHGYGHYGHYGHR